MHNTLTNAACCALQHNGGSKANGALMRAVPLALWGCRLEPEQLAAACSQDTRLSHPNQSCQVTLGTV